MAKKKTIKGTSSRDWLFGTMLNDMMDGLKGNDSLSGLAGNDKLYGRLGDDTLSGGSGNDALWGEDDDDGLSGGRGNDRLYGGKGDDDLEGGSENDRLDGGEGSDYLNGGDGSDNLLGGNGNDQLDGGIDTVKDVLSGGAGRDFVTIRGADVALGGKDVDTLIIGPNFGPDFIKYTINLSGITGNRAADIGLDGARAGQFEKASVTIYDAASGTSVTGSKGDDVIMVYGKSGTVQGGAGNDRITVGGSGSADATPLYFTVDGGSGSDHITSHGPNTVAGGAGSDIFVVRTAGLSDGSTILDFTSADRLLVDFLTTDKTLDMANLLVVGSDPVATSALGQFLYDTDDGRLFLDEDGTGTGDAAHVWTLANKAALTAKNFIIDL
jgi:Ca2+-binding RTX toxin-like protein